MRPHRRLIPALLAVALLATLIASAAPSAGAPSARCAGPEHPKSALGLMPPACGPDPDAVQLMNEDALIPYLSAPAALALDGWPELLAAANVSPGGGNELSAFTTRYDEPGDNMLHLFGHDGAALTQLQRAPAGEAPKAALATDLGHDGSPEFIVALAGEDRLAVYTSTLAAPPLAGPLSVARPGQPDGLAAGDFTGDLLDDIAATAPTSGTIAILRGGPGGALEPFAELPFPTGGFSALAVGDFDNNGYDDIAALRGAGYRNDAVVIFYQSLAGFTSATLSPETGGFLAHSLAAGDLDGDGRDDLAVTAGGNKPRAYLNIYLQTDDGLVARPPILAHHHPGPLAIGDITHDGRDDVAVLHGDWRALSVYRQQADGTLAGPDMATLPYSSHHRPNALALSDLDGNHSLDVAFAQLAPGVVAMYNTTSASVAAISTPPHASSIVAGEVAVAGTANVGTARVQIRVRGLSDWADTSLAAGAWQGTVSLPAEARPWTIEARAIDGAGVVQAPTARVRVWSRPPLVGFAVADNGRAPGSVDRLVRFDPVTGVATLIGPTGTTEIHSLVYLPTLEKLFTANGHRLGTIDLATGIFTPLPQTLGQGRNGALQVQFSNIQGLTLDPTSGHLFAVMRRVGSGKADLLFKIDPGTGVRVPHAFGPSRDFVPISGEAVLEDVDDLAYDAASGTLYAVGNQGAQHDRLATINTTTGAASVVGLLGVANVEGLTLAADGTLYGSTGTTGVNSPTGDRLWTISKTTGAATLVGPFGIESDYEGLAMVPAAIAPPDPPAVPPIEALTVEALAQVTTSKDVRLRGTTAASGVILAEYWYDLAARSWAMPTDNMLLATGALSAAALSAGLDWTLDSAPGVHYFLAWSTTADGKRAPVAEHVLVNYIPPTITVAPGTPIIYRFTLAAGERLDLDLKTLSGSAKLVVWSGSPDVAPIAAAERLSVTAEEDELYQVEIHAPHGAMVQLSASSVASDAPGAATPTGAGDGLPTRPVIPLDAIPDLRRTPEPLSTSQIYLPLLYR